MNIIAVNPTRCIRFTSNECAQAYTEAFERLDESKTQ